jgi:APA family basic amino acid/polyamine antiporter
MDSKYKIGFFTAISLVIANMIGTGVFTSLGFQLVNLSSGFTILVLWILGGIVALCGALVYSELGVAIPKSGGEYVYLSKLIHPAVGFLSGWTSSTVGFAAPVALASMALGSYLNKLFPFLNPTSSALLVVVFLTMIHSLNLKTGSAFQKTATIIKILVILMFIIAGIIHTPQHQISFAPETISWNEITSSAFWVSLIYVSYAYSGWNAASYMAGEMQNTKRDLPLSLFFGTLIVTVIYALLNFVFLYTAPISELSGVVEVGHVSASRIFGTQLGNMMSGVIAVLLLSSISAMIMAGPRIMKAMGDDIQSLRFLSKTNNKGVPYVSVITQSAITIVLILTSQFEAVLTFVGFSLSIFTFLAVFSVFMLRQQNELNYSYKTFGYPLTPIIFLALNGFTIYFVFTQKPVESLYGLLNLTIGFGVYYISKKKNNSYV